MKWIKNIYQALTADFVKFIFIYVNDSFHQIY